jgi:methyl-accepting chemotaxis protein
MSREEPKKFKRRIVYIKKDYQRSFILRYCLVALAALIVTGALVYYLSNDTMTATYRYNELKLQQTAEVILPALLVAGAVVLVAFLAATVFLTLFVSHKIAGPLYRFGKTIESIGEGNLQERIHLREKDQLKDFAEQVNNMTENLSRRVERIEAEISRLKAKTASGAELATFKEDLDRLEATLNELFKRKR